MMYKLTMFAWQGYGDPDDDGEEYGRRVEIGTESYDRLEEVIHRTRELIQDDIRVVVRRMSDGADITTQVMRSVWR